MRNYYRGSSEAFALNELREVLEKHSALFAPPAPVAVTREKLSDVIETAVRGQPYCNRHTDIQRATDAVFSALSAPVSAEQTAVLDALQKTGPMMHEGSRLVLHFATSDESWALMHAIAKYGKALKSIGIATEGT